MKVNSSKLSMAAENDSAPSRPTDTWRKSIDLRVEQTPVSQVYTGNPTWPNQSIAAAMDWVIKYSSGTPEPFTESEKRLKKDTRQRKKYEEDANEKAAILFGLIDSGRLDPAQQGIARAVLQGLLQAFAHILSVASEKQRMEVERRHGLIRAVAQAYATERSINGHQAPCEVGTDAPDQEQNHDRPPSEDGAPKGRKATRPPPLNLVPGGFFAQDFAHAMLSNRRPSSQLERQEPGSELNDRQAGSSSPAFSNAHPTPRKEQDLTSAGSVGRAMDGAQNTFPSPERGGLPAGTKSCAAQTSNDSRLEAHAGIEKLPCKRPLASEEEQHGVSGDVHVSQRESVVLSVRDSSSNMSTVHNQLIDSAAPGGSNTTLAPSAASCKPKLEPSPKTVVDGNGGKHHVKNDENATLAGAQSVRSTIRQPPVSGSSIQRPDESDRNRRRPSIFRESFLVEHVGPSWSSPTTSDQQDTDAGDSVNVLHGLYDASWEFLLRQTLPWLQIACFISTFAYACLFSVVGYVFTPVQTVFIRFDRDIVHPLPIPIISEVPDGSRLVLATQMTTILGLLALLAAVRLERVRESWLEANGVTRVLFLDYLRSV